VYAIMPNLDQWMNQEHSKKKEEESTTTSNFKTYLLSIKIERSEMIRPNCHSTYNECPQRL